MKKLISVLFLVICFNANSQINLATTLRQDTIIKVLRQIISASTSTFVNIYGTTSNITTSSTTDVLPAPGAGLYIYITDILVTNGSASGDTWVKIIEQTSNTILWSGFASSGGGGFSTSLKTAIKLPNSNTKVQAICETAGAEVRVNISGYKGL